MRKRVWCKLRKFANLPFNLNRFIIFIIQTIVFPKADLYEHQPLLDAAKPDLYTSHSSNGTTVAVNTKSATVSAPQNFLPNTMLKNVFHKILKSNHHERCSR